MESIIIIPVVGFLDIVTLIYKFKCFIVLKYSIINVQKSSSV